MYKFIRLIIIFVILLTTITIFVIQLVEVHVRQKASFKLQKSPTYVIFGHSHSACAFNDALLKNFKNLSDPGESYFYTYFKVKEIIEQNPSIEVIFIEFTNNQILDIMNDWTWENKYLKYRYPIYAPFIKTHDKYLLVKNNFNGFVAANSLSLKAGISKIYKNDYDFTNIIGGFQALDKVLSYSLNNTKGKTPSLNLNNTSATNIRYLRLIVDFCKQKGKTIVLIRSPLHKQYQGYYNELEYQKFLQTDFFDVEYLDFSKIPLKDSCFLDPEHLNLRGSKEFSVWLSNVINNSPLNVAGLREAIPHY